MLLHLGEAIIIARLNLVTLFDFFLAEIAWLVPLKNVFSPFSRLSLRFKRCQSNNTILTRIKIDTFQWHDCHTAFVISLRKLRGRFAIGYVFQRKKNLISKEETLPKLSKTLLCSWRTKFIYSSSSLVSLQNRNSMHPVTIKELWIMSTIQMTIW